jgi:hypothetical protein
MENKKSISLDQFIDGAHDERDAKVARKRTTYDRILLSATGKIEKRNKYTRVLFYLDPDVEEKINTYCSGTKQAVLSYLIKRGLDELIKENKVIVYEIS